jgi:hypothetical protein
MMTAAEEAEWIQAWLGRADLAALKFICVALPEPVMDLTGNQPKADANGEPLYGIDVVVFTDGPALVFCVEFPGSPAPGLRQCMRVEVTGLVLSDWAVNDRQDVTFRASKVEAAQAEKGGAA